MWTIAYRGYFIHGYCDRSACHATINGRRFHCKTLTGAKRLITRLTAGPVFLAW